MKKLNNKIETFNQLNREYMFVKFLITIKT